MGERYVHNHRISIASFEFVMSNFYIQGTNTISRLVRNVHDGSIFSICVLKDGTVVTGGGKDGRILHFDATFKLNGQEAQVSEH